LDLIAHRIARYLEETGARAVPVPADEPYRHWEPERLYGRGDLSHRHAAQAAGLGALGKSSLLITREYGNRVHLVSIVTDADLSADEVLDWEPCPPGCTLCLRACPAGALAGERVVDQSLCRPVSITPLPRGAHIESCWACRKACPVGVTRRK
jgi:epoxyqueuosine reductase QueG